MILIIGMGSQCSSMKHLAQSDMSLTSCRCPLKECYGFCKILHVRSQFDSDMSKAFNNQLVRLAVVAKALKRRAAMLSDEHIYRIISVVGVERA